MTTPPHAIEPHPRGKPQESPAATPGSDGTGLDSVLSAFAGKLRIGADPAEQIRLLKLILFNLTEAMVVADAGGNLILHNPASLDLHGYASMEQALGAMGAVAVVWEVTTLDGTPLPQEAWPLARALRGERFEEYQVHVRRSDTGKAFIGAYSGMPILDDNGALYYAFITIRDITRQKEAEVERTRLLLTLENERHALRRREQELLELNESLEQRVEARTEALSRSAEALLEARNRFFTLFHASPVPTYLTALEDGTMVDANSAFLELFNLRREEVVGQPSQALAERVRVRPEEQAQLEARLQKHGWVHDVEMHAVDGDRREHVILLSAETATVDERPVAITTLIDITERKEAEEKVRQLAIQLSRAQERERARIAQVLHDDLQQLVVALQMQLDMARDGDPEEMRAALQAGRSYADQILDVSRDLTVELSPPLSRGEQLRDGFRWLRGFMDDHYGLDVRLEVGEEVRLADPDLRTFLLRLVRELLFNTVKHAGVEQASVRAYRSGDDLVTEVEDGGQGFDPEILQKHASGTGYGLSSMADRVRLFGGAFELDSVPGEGTRVKIIIPAS